MRQCGHKSLFLNQVPFPFVDSVEGTDLDDLPKNAGTWISSKRGKATSAMRLYVSVVML